MMNRIITVLCILVIIMTTVVISFAGDREKYEFRFSKTDVLDMIK